MKKGRKPFGNRRETGRNSGGIRTERGSKPDRNLSETGRKPDGKRNGNRGRKPGQETGAGNRGRKRVRERGGTGGK